VTTSEQVNEIAAAMAKAQAELKPASKDAVNPAFKSRYADLAAIIEAGRVYSKFGVVIVQEAVLVEMGVAVTTRLIHDRGQWIEVGPLTVPLAKKDAHGIGSATTYAKRYALSAALNISSDEDDDGNAAVAAAPVKKVEPAPEGYDQWYLDLVAVADNGLDALRDMYRKSQPYFRKYLEDTDPGQIDKLKKKAAVTKPQAVPA